MSAHFPPSSPIRFGTGSYVIEGTKSRKQLIDEPDSVGRYLTPEPSSTLGRSSSPVRASHHEEEPKEAAQEVKRLKQAFCRSVEIVLDARDSSRLAIGRKRDVCDIHLPSVKHVSRQHAFISYVAETKQVQLTCNGMNGLIVVFPQRLSYELIKRLDPPSFYELVAEPADDAESRVPYREKVLVRCHELTSFVLLMGETVLMPFIEGTILDFRQCVATLSLRDDIHDEEDTKNDTETEDEQMPIETNSDDFQQGYKSSSTDWSALDADSSPKTLRLNDPERICSVQSSPVAASGSPQPTSPPGQCQLVTPMTSFPEDIPTTPVKCRINDTLSDTAGPNSNANFDKSRKRTFTDATEDTPISMHRSFNAIKTENDKDTSVMNHEEDSENVAEETSDTQELQNILANHLAFSNVQQVPLSSLQDVNSKISRLSREQLRDILAKESCIGVIYRTGKDAAGKELDEEYYYDLENDSDQNRRQIVLALKGGRTGLRACRKVHKQYFWKKPTK
ncbi:HCL627Cp [Eremothecium sinecaudum]|uniref:HCL627Cp n=1 Tax=Eremothecium sinecaudum TaxID=45286 RepID=A0A109UXW9_9SACH|nr:HCL627Cp [Eremothecium sinecaudum]AMD19524.1 HCL627Cp [Eremothecium sinecaudum]